MSDHNGKRKRVETVDLTADDTDDTDDLDAPVRASKRQEVSSTPKPQQRPDTRPVGSNNGTTPSFRGSSYLFSGNGFPASTTHTEAERRDWLGEDDDDINETIGSKQLDAANGSDELHLYGDLDIKIVGVQYYRGFACEGEVILIHGESQEILTTQMPSALTTSTGSRSDTSHVGWLRNCQSISTTDRCTAKAS